MPRYIEDDITKLHLLTTLLGKYISNQFHNEVLGLVVVKRNQL